MENDNLLAIRDLDPRLRWLSAPPRWERLEQGGIRVFAGGKTDFFADPDGALPKSSAPILCLDVEGDFTARLRVRPTFREVYDGGGLMVVADERHHIKLCYEKTDVGPTAIVSVVTNPFSDDANGAEVKAETVWLQIARKGQLFALHHSLDGEAWRMTRYFGLALPNHVQVGLAAQSPVGAEAVVDFAHLAVASRAPKKLRDGV